MQTTTPDPTTGTHPEPRAAPSAGPGPAADGAPPLRTPVWGTRADRAGALRAGLAAGLAVVAYTLAARTWAPEFAPSDLEIFGTWTSMACVWLTRRQNIWSMPFGIVSVLAMGKFFFDIDLVGQGWLHLGFYFPVQFLAWWLWLRGGDGHGELGVTWLTWRSRAVFAVAIAAGAFGLAAIFAALHGDTPYALWDAEIVAASIAAQVLLTTKKVESWVLWMVPVNVAAIGLYLHTGAVMFAVLYVLYLANAAVGLADWVKANRARTAGLSAFEARHVD